MEKYYSLNDIEPGQRAVIKKNRSVGGMRRRLLDLGLVEGTEIECVGKSPCGDPRAFLILGAVIAIRSVDCEKIAVLPCFAG